MKTKQELKQEFQAGMTVTEVKMADLIENMHGNESGITFAELMQLEADGNLIPGQSYDVTDFFPKYKAKYSPVEYFTETVARPLRFYAKKHNKLSIIGEMIDEDFNFEFDFTTTSIFPQGRILKIWGNGYEGTILNGQKIYWNVNYGFQCAIAPENLFENNVLGGGNLLLGECIRIDSTSKNIKVDYGCYNQQFMGRNINIKLEYGCFDQVFGDRSTGQHIGQGCSGQVFGYYCIGQKFGVSCNDQIFGDNCSSGLFSDKINGLDFRNATHINQNKTCNIFLDEDSVPKLSYVDNSGNIQVVDPVS